jgi:hypothetical protein
MAGAATSTRCSGTLQPQRGASPTSTSATCAGKAPNYHEMLVDDGDTDMLQRAADPGPQRLRRRDHPRSHPAPRVRRALARRAWPTRWDGSGPPSPPSSGASPQHSRRQRREFRGNDQIPIGNDQRQKQRDGDAVTGWAASGICRSGRFVGRVDGLRLRAAPALKDLVDHAQRRLRVEVVEFPPRRTSRPSGRRCPAPRRQPARYGCRTRPATGCGAGPRP